jgi:hypothetical protein
MLGGHLPVLSEIKGERMNLFRLAEKKEKLKRKLAKINEAIEKIDKEAISYRGKGTWGQDLFISCLVNDLHFEVEKDEPKGDLKCQ